MKECVADYMNFFPLISNVMSYYQNIGIILITASALLFFNIKKDKYNCIVLLIWICAGVSGALSVIYLIIGFSIYQEIINSFFDLTTSCDRFEYREIDKYFTYQSWVGLISTAFLLLSFMFFIISRRIKK